jgi:hypothetical protein
MRELVPLVVGDEHPVVDRPVEALRHPVGVAVGSGHDLVELGGSSEAGKHLEHGFDAGGLRPQSLADGVGHLGGPGSVDLGRRVELAVALHERSGAGEAVHEVLDEERVPPGRTMDPRLEPALGCRDPERAEELGDLGLAEPGERQVVADLLAAETGELGGHPPADLGPVAGDQHHRDPAGPARRRQPRPRGG